jgi:hypothetical protein
MPVFSVWQPPDGLRNRLGAIPVPFLGQPVKLTIAFSKKFENLESACALFVAYYGIPTTAGSPASYAPPLR